MVYCKCKEWKPGIEHVSMFVTFGSQHDVMFDKKYIFKYCPWCGKKLLEE